MVASMGAQSHLGMDASSATSTEEYEFSGLTQRMQEQLLDPAGLGGTRSHISERVRQGTRAPGYSVTLQPNSVELDKLLPRILGGTEAADAFPLAETLPTFVTNIDNIQKRFHYTGCKVSRAVFRGSQGQPLDLQLEVEALDFTESATAFPTLSISTVAPYILSDLVLTVGGSGYQFRDFELSIDNALDVARFFLGQTRVSLPERDRIITWTLSGPYGDNSALFGLAVAGTACVATFTNGSRSLAFSSTKVQFPRELPAFADREEVMLPLTGIARKDGATLELTTTNDSV